MIPAPKYETLCNELIRGFFDYSRYPGDVNSDSSSDQYLAYIEGGQGPGPRLTKYNPIPIPDKVKMIGLVFCQPQHTLAKEEIVPCLNYYHYRSGININFYFSGFGAYWQPDEYLDKEHVGKIEGTTWYFSAKAFNDFRVSVEQRSSWQYSGEIDLILINANLHPDQKTVNLNFEEAIACNLSEMKRKNTIPSIMGFFETIFKYADEQNGKDPTWGFSDCMGLHGAQSALKGLILGLLPKDLGKDVERLSHFAIKDISPNN